MSASASPPIPTNQPASARRTKQLAPWQLDTRRLVLAITFILLFAMAVRIPVDSDTWWHLRSGDYMVTNRTILMNDPFSLTRQGQAWINHSWGAQLIMAGFYHAFGGNGDSGGGGAVGLALYTALLAVAGMAVVASMCEGNPYTRGFVLILGAATAAVFWSARPQMISFVLSAVTLYILYLYKWRKVDRLWLLPAMMIVWVNLHGGFAIGFILLFGMIAGEGLGRLFDSANPNVLSWRAIGKLSLVTGVAALALVINPNTVQMWGYPFRTFGIGALQAFIQEWNSPNFHNRETWPFVILLLGTLAAAGLAQRRLEWSDVVLLGGTAFMGLYAGRNIATFALVASPILARQLTAWLDERGWRLRPALPPTRVGLIVNYTLLVAVIAGAALYIFSTLLPRTVAKAQADYLPIGAAAYLNANVDPTSAGAMFNSYNWGGYLMFAAPKFPVFVDGRTDLYDDALLREWLSATNGQQWRETFAEWNIRLAVIEKDSALATQLRGEADWREVWSDDKAAIFRKGMIP